MVREETLQSTSRLRSFLTSLDTGSVDWIDTTERWLLKELDNYMPKPVRKATFSVGEDMGVDEVSEICCDRPIMVDCETQCDPQATTIPAVVINATSNDVVKVTNDGSLDDIKQSWKEGKDVRPGDALRLLNRDLIKHRELEKRFLPVEAVAVRRAFLSAKDNFSLANLPYKEFDYVQMKDQCCENVIGMIPVPVGVVGPLKVKGKKREGTYFIPMATTEGALVASTNRGCKAIMESGGITATVYDDKMTRGPVVQFPTSKEAESFQCWISEKENYAEVKERFESTSKFCKLKEIAIDLNEDLVYITFMASTGDAMGMNMISKACEAALKFLTERFPSMEVLALSGNVCTDKKASSLNWARGRGRSVVSECTIKRAVVEKLFKTTSGRFVKVANAKLEKGSNIAGCIGGENAQAANIVAAIFIATGQDAAHVISSGMCCTQMKMTSNGDLNVKCTMPVMEVGTVGGGTILPPQNDCLKMLKCRDFSASAYSPGDNARALAEIICSTVLAGELSLMASLCEGSLVKSHMKYNRSTQQLYTTPVPEMTLPSFSLTNTKQSSRTKRNSEASNCSNIL